MVTAIAAAASVPLIAQVKNAQNAQRQAAGQNSAEQAGPSLPPSDTTPPPPAIKVDPSKVIASSGSVQVTAGEFDAVVATLGPQAEMALAQPGMKKRVADQILQIKLLAEEAKRRKLQDTPKVKEQQEMLERQIEMQKDELLAQALAQSVQSGGDEKGNRDYFEANKSDFDNMKARHILIRTPDSPVPEEAGKKSLTEAQAKAKAQQIKTQLDKGGDFAAIAKAESDDKGSGLKGGDLGTFAPWKMDATFSKAALGLKKNQISQPIKTKFGYHIIQMLDDAPRTYEQAKDEVGQARMSALVSQLQGNTKTEYDPAFFGLAAANPPSTSQPAAARGTVPAQPSGQRKGGA